MRDVDTAELVAQANWWCVHPATYVPTSFNPNSEGDQTDPAGGGRFDPFHAMDVERSRVPTKYLADHPNAAFAETLLRDDQRIRRLSIEAVRSHRLSLLSMTRTLQVADLNVLETHPSFGEALRQGRSAYVALRRLAAIVHAQARPVFDGLLWNGRQLDQPGMLCTMLFGDCVAGQDDLRVIESYALDHGAGLRRLQSAATLRQFALPAMLVKRTLQMITTTR